MNRFPQSCVDSPARSAIVLAGFLLALLARPAWSQDASKESALVPKDTCILELTLPEGTTTSIDGDDQGIKRRMTWSKLKPGVIYQTRLTVTFRNGGSDERTILVEGGRRIRLALPSPSAKMPKIVPQVGHTHVQHARLSSDGRWLLTGGNDGLAVLWNVKTGRSIRVFRGLEGDVEHLAMSRNSTRILAASSKAVGIWDLDSADQPRFFRKGDVYFAAISTDGRYLASSLRDSGEEYSVVTVWDVKSGERVHTLRGHENNVRAAAFSPDGRQLLTGATRSLKLTADQQREMLEQLKNLQKHEGTYLEVLQAARKMKVNRCIGEAIQWDLTTGELLRKCEGHNDDIRAVAISPDGHKLATASDDGSLILWNAADGKKLVTLKKGDSFFDMQGFTNVQFSPDGRQLLGSSRGGAILWDSAGSKQLHSIRSGIASQMIGIAFAPDGPMAVTAGSSVGGSSLLIRVWSVVSQKEVLAPIRQESHSVNALALSPDGQYIAAVNISDNSPMVLDGRTGRCGFLGGNALTGYLWAPAEIVSPGSSGVLTGHANSVTSLAFSPDGRRMLTGSYDATAILWDTETGRQVHKLQGHRGPSQSLRQSMPLRLSFGLRYLASGGNLESTLGSMRLKDMAQLQESQPGYVHCVAFGADGRCAITGGEDEKAIVWDCATGRKKRELIIPRAAPESPDKSPKPRRVERVALSRDGRLALTEATYPRILVLWDARTGEKIKTLEKDIDDLYAFAFSADDRPLALMRLHDNSGKYPVSLVNVKTDQVVRVISSIAATDSLHTAVFSPDQRRVAFSLWSKGAVAVFDLDLGAELRRLEGHDADVKAMAFSPDGQRLLTGSDDGTCRLWNIATGQELARITTLKGENDWLMTTPEGLFDGSAGGREKVMFRVGSGLDVVPVDRFFQDFYYPGLLAAIWRGERPLPRVEMGGSLPPKVTIVAPNDGGVVEQNRTTVNVEALDQGGGIRGPWLIQNGARVLAAGKTERKGKTIRRVFEVPLVQGENRLEFYAASADGSWESEPAVVTLRYEKPLPKPDLYLVSVGVNRCAEKSIGLGFAAADAQAIAELFRQRGPSLYRAVHATTLLDERATAAAIVEALRQLSEQSRPQDTVAVFLSGHGAVVGRQYYFLPHEFHRQAKSWDEDVRLQGLSAQRLQETLVAAAALKRVVVFDTGQSGGAIGLVKTARDSFALRGAIERLSRASGAFMIASAAVSDEAQEVPDLKHGVLTYALLAGLHAAPGGPLDNQWIQPKNKDRVADVLDWFGFASAHVPQLTKRYFGQQQELQHSSFGTSFPILPVAASGAPAPIASTAVSPPTSQPIVASAVRGLGEVRLHVVGVGINRYHDEAMNLKFARSDVESIVKLFHRRGQRLYREVATTEVLDAQATKEAILSSLAGAARRATADDALVVFFSGHGRMVGQRYFFIPSDFHRQESTVEEDVRRQGVPADVLADAVSKSPAQKRILIFDTCASGGALSISRQGQDPFAFRGAIAKLRQRQGVFTIAASAAGQEAQEIDSLGHGVLTYALLAGVRAVPPGGPLEGLSVQPNGPEGMVDVLDWFSFASGHVPHLTKQYLHQVQEVQTTAQGTSFSLLPAWEQ
jgi:WD40 repeat protein/uncharacterized caspase-like protein